MSVSDRQFTGALPESHHRCLGPVLFEPYAAELAAGTGILTRAVVDVLPDATVVATDAAIPT